MTEIEKITELRQSMVKLWYTVRDKKLDLIAIKSSTKKEEFFIGAIFQGMEIADTAIIRAIEYLDEIKKSKESGND